MSDYIIFTDSACDLDKSTLDEWGVKCVELKFSFDGEDKAYGNYEMPYKDFYDRMREGASAKTSAVNVEEFKESFISYLKEGKDILYIGFSSGLSTTFNSAKIAADDLMAEYPRRNVRVVDSLCASAGQGLLVYLCVKKKNAGKSLDEVAEYAHDTIPNLCHWFTVDDLVYLKRGGRISPTVAFVGGVLGVKPVLHVDDQGMLVNVTKSRGRMKALQAIVDKFSESCLDPNSEIFISHSDCIDDVKKIDDMIKEKFGVRAKNISYIGPVIGAHTGPGTIAFFFIGKQR